MRPIGESSHQLVDFATILPGLVLKKQEQTRLNLPLALSRREIGRSPLIVCLPVPAGS